MAAYEVLLLNTAVPQIQAAQSGDTYVVPRDIAFSAALTLSAGTANGVPYLDGSKVLTTGSALTFDGSIVSNTGVGFNVNNANALFRFQNGSGTRTGYFQVRADAFDIWSDQAAVPMVFGVANSEQMRLTSTGLGIGTSSPASQLDVSKTGDATISLTSAGVQRYQLITRSGGNFEVYDQSSAASRLTLTQSGNLGLGVTPSAWGGSYKAFEGTYGGALSFYAAGNFPATWMSSNAYHNGTSWIAKVTDQSCLYTQEGTTGKHMWHVVSSDTTAGNAISFTQALTLTAAGDLLVGLTTAQVGERLSVRGAGTALAYFDQTTNTSGYSGIWVNIEQNGNDTSTYHFKGETTGINSWYLYGNGTTSYSSDSRLKKNIETARNGYLDDLMQLRVVKYNWNNHEEGTPKELGLIAQEVEQVFPGLIQEHEIEGVDGPRKHIKHSVMEFIMIKAIQEQQAMINELKAEVAALKGN